MFEPGILDYIDGDVASLEARACWRGWRAERQLAAYRHDGFWQCMDTVRDLRLLQEPVGFGQSALEDVA